MSRDIPVDLQTEVDAPVVRPFLAVRIELPDPVYVWTGWGTITFDDADGGSHYWLGTGELGSIDSLGETTDGSASGMRASLNAIPSEFRTDIEEQAQRGSKQEIYIGSLNETYQTVEAAVLLNRYRLDKYEITDGGDSIGVEVAGESRAIDRRAAVKRFTNEYQQRNHPGDRGLEYVSQMTEVSILWAQAESKSPSVGGGLPSATGGGFLTRNIRSV